MENLMRKVHNRKGFTLIELIIVIVILAILAAIAIPAVSKYVGEAKKSQEEGNLAVVKSAAGAAAAYATTGGSVVGTVFRDEINSILGENATSSTSNTFRIILLKASENYDVYVYTSGAVSISAIKK